MAKARRGTPARIAVVLASLAAWPAGAAAVTTPGSVVTPSPSSGGGVDPATIRGWVPNDHIGDVPWTALQWNFAGPYGVNAPAAWAQLRATGTAHEGGRHVRIAVIDSGIAYRTTGPYQASPDLIGTRILQGYDFVDEDRFPDDTTGHGTHVASTIAGSTNNDAGLTGLAYDAEILPIRVLRPPKDEGDIPAIARGIDYAVRRHADLINLSVDFPVSTRSADIPDVLSAVRYARRKGILVIASSGNDGAGEVALPARSGDALAVGATTAHGCRSRFSNGGAALDLVAPGGGLDHDGEKSDRCRLFDPGPPIAQVTLLRSGSPGTLGVPMNYVGTSMATAHVTGVAALVLGSGILGRHPSPDLLAAYLVRATRDLGPRGWDSRYGAGLVDAALATNPAIAPALRQSAKRAVAKAKRAGSTVLPTALPGR